MLEHEPKFQALSEEKKKELLRRVMKVYAAHRYPERPQKLREEYGKIYAELGIRQPRS